MFRKSIQKPFKTSSMSLQKVQSFEEKRRDQSQQKKLQIVKGGGISMKMHAVQKQGIAQQGVINKTLLWSGLYPTRVGERIRYLVFKNIEYVIAGWTGDGFPSVLYITVDGLSGYLNSALTTTQRAAALQLSEISAVYDGSDVRTYDLKYVLRDSVTWQVLPTFTNVKIRMFIDQQTTPIVLPLPNPITLNLEMRVQ